MVDQQALQIEPTGWLCLAQGKEAATPASEAETDCFLKKMDHWSPEDGDDGGSCGPPRQT